MWTLAPERASDGGEIIAEGTVEDIKKVPESITGQYLSGKKQIEVPKERRAGKGTAITIKARLRTI